VSSDAGRSPAHRLPPLARLALTLAVILIGVLTPPERWPLHGVLIALTFAGQSLAGIPLAYLGRRLAVFLPVLAVFALSLPISQGLSAGWDVAAGVMLRGTVSFMAVLWLAGVMSFPVLIETLRRLRLPEVLLTTLAFTHRYLFVLWDELETMRQARRARDFGRQPLGGRWRTSAQLIGMLLVRAMSRAERVHWAMCARGWDGRIRRLDGKR
jgi:cobalt/nickel transport system permease protein